jgi:hypothetical protein
MSLDRSGFRLLDAAEKPSSGTVIVSSAHTIIFEDTANSKFNFDTYLLMRNATSVREQMKKINIEPPNPG